MFYKKKYEDRLTEWRNFRTTLENSDDPIQETINYYSNIPLVKFQCDPYDRETWPSAWETIQENVYCEFVKLLGICYTLQLTDCLKHETFEIHITHDLESSEIHYLLYVGDRVVGFNGESHVTRNGLPLSLRSQHVYVMPLLQ